MPCKLAVSNYYFFLMSISFFSQENDQHFGFFFATKYKAFEIFFKNLVFLFDLTAINS